MDDELKNDSSSLNPVQDPQPEPRMSKGPADETDPRDSRNFIMEPHPGALVPESQEAGSQKTKEENEKRIVGSDSMNEKGELNPSLTYSKENQRVKTNENFHKEDELVMSQLLSEADHADDQKETFQVGNKETVQMENKETPIMGIKEAGELYRGEIIGNPQEGGESTRKDQNQDEQNYKGEQEQFNGETDERELNKVKEETKSQTGTVSEPDRENIKNSLDFRENHETEGNSRKDLLKASGEEEDKRKNRELEKLREMNEKYEDNEEYEQKIRAQIKELPHGKIPEDQRKIIQYLLNRLDEVEVLISFHSFIEFLVEALSLLWTFALDLDRFRHFDGIRMFFAKPKK